ncbi:MAG: hypothetical protein LBN96_06905 [Desulfovibrio sp.]|nr:hypothetical protein [Desulfovibrio sp.]
MQKDMHYYGTYAMAKAAGIPQRDAETIAYAAQFTDDSTRYNSKIHRDHGLLYGIATAHSPARTLIDNFSDKLHGDTDEEQRRVWVPFHFLPGGAGESFEEKILCVKDSPIAKDMLEYNLKIGIDKRYCLELIGITAHVYMDTFSHYGFSGLTSKFNEIKRSSWKSYDSTYENLVGGVAQFAGENLGHAGVATCPDQPYLEWEFDFILPRPNNGKTSKRNNTENFMEGCRKLHRFFCDFAKKKYDTASETMIDFDNIEGDVRKLLAFRANEEERCRNWKKSTLTQGAKEYNPIVWERDKKEILRFSTSAEIIQSEIYMFHQAATFHRYYVLKDLLPSHGIAVY